jgi:Ser/Thr protein kinase RdoA (MazF antagonist)
LSSRDREQFSADELARVISHYRLGIIDDVLEFNRGSRKSPKLYLNTATGKYLLKRRARGRNGTRRAAMAHRVQQHLAEHGFPAPRIALAEPDHTTLLTLNDRVYELFEFISGQDYAGSLGETFEAGRTLGLFHKLVTDFVIDAPTPAESFHDANAVRTGLNAIPSTISAHDSVRGYEVDLHETVNKLYDAYDAAAEAADRAGVKHSRNYQLVHSDWHPGNLLFEDGRVVGVVDFDSIRVAPRATDVANGALQFSIVSDGSTPGDWPDYIDQTRLKRFLLGYDQESAVTPDEIQALVPLMIEALIAEAVVPIAATGSFGRATGFGFLKMVKRKVRWLQKNAERLTGVLTA